MACQTTVVTLLVENEAPPGLEPEFGLSLWIEADGLNILFDTGQGRALVPNAARLGVDLSQASFIVLSHGHFDHSGGLAQALLLAPKARLVLNPAALVPRFSLHPGEAPHAVGMPEDALAAVNALPAERLIWSEHPLQLTPDIGVTGVIPRESCFEDVGGPFFLDAAGRRPDTLPDDQALWIKTAGGLVVCLGCGHAGVINTARCIKQLAGEERIRAVIGGLHLVHAGADRMDQTIYALKELNAKRLMPCHCTGKAAIEQIKSALGSKIVSDLAGRRFVFEKHDHGEEEPLCL